MSELVTIDLHTHSTWSSGFCDPAELVRWASMADVRSLAIADHHEVGAYGEARDAASRCGVELVPAIELDCTSEGRRVDLLGLWIDPESAGLRRFLDAWPSGMRQMLEDEALLAWLSDAAGATIDRETISRGADGRPAGTLSVMLALVRAGFGATIGDAFRQYRRLRETGSPPRRPRRYPRAQEGAAAIRAAGGVVILAHPGLVHDDALVEELLATGVADAVEARYGGYYRRGDEVNARFLAMAVRLGVPVSAGSDFHAYPFDPVRLGVQAPADTVARLRGSARR